MATRVFNACYGPTSGLDISLFKKFKIKLNVTDQSNQQSCWLLAKMTEVLQFMYKALESGKYQDDYREFIELSIFLGVMIPKYCFKRLREMHQAWWMAKVSYCLKMWMFQKQVSKGNLYKRRKHVHIDHLPKSLGHISNHCCSAIQWSVAPSKTISITRKLQQPQCQILKPTCGTYQRK